VQESIGFLLALGVPLFLGQIFFQLVGGAPHPSLRLGYGINIGYSILSVLLWAVSQLSAYSPTSVHARGISIASIAYFTVLLFLRLRKLAEPNENWLKAPIARTALWFKSVTIVELVLLIFCALSMSMVAIGALIHPLFPWDAWDFWGAQAKHWLMTGDLTYRLSNQYPPFVPFMQYWSLHFFTAYNDSASNLPFIACFAGLIFAIYGQIRSIGGSRQSALLVSNLIASMPLLAVHNAIPGYADSLTSIAFCLASMSLLVAFHNREKGARWRIQAILAISCITMVCLFKRPGIFWGLAFVAASFLALKPYLSSSAWRWTFLLILPASAVSFLLINRASGYFSSLNELSPDFLRNVGLLLNNAVVWGNYSTLWPAVALLLMVGYVNLKQARLVSGAFAAIALVVGALFVGLAVYQTYEYWTTVVGRALLHVAPAALFASAAWVILALEGKKIRHDQ
jgi:hypothetical protein